MSGGAVNLDQISAELLNILPFPLLLIDQKNCFVWLNPAAESFFKSSTAFLVMLLLNSYPLTVLFFALLNG